MFNNIFNDNEVAYVLRNIGGWHTYSYFHIENKELVDFVFDKGFITYRLCYSSIHPTEADLAFELMDKGLDFLKQFDVDLYIGACKMRQWYRDNASHFITNGK